MTPDGARRLIERQAEAHEFLCTFYAERYAKQARAAATRALHRTVTKEEMSTAIATPRFDHHTRVITYSFTSLDIDDAVVTTLVSFLVPPPAFTPVHTSEIPEQYQDL